MSLVLGDRFKQEYFRLEPGTNVTFSGVERGVKYNTFMEKDKDGNGMIQIQYLHPDEISVTFWLSDNQITRTILKKKEAVPNSKQFWEISHEINFQDNKKHGLEKRTSELQNLADDEEPRESILEMTWDRGVLHGPYYEVDRYGHANSGQYFDGEMYGFWSNEDESSFYVHGEEVDENEYFAQLFSELIRNSSMPAELASIVGEFVASDQND